MVVQRDAGEGGNVDAELQRVLYLLCQQGVQCVDAFNNEYAVVVEFQLLAVPLAFARREVILRNLHTLALHQTSQVVFQEVVVYCLNVVEVVIAVRQFGGVDTIHEVVVCRERQGAQSTRQQLYAQTLAERRLTTAARTSDEYQTDGVLLCVEATVYLFSNLHNLLLLQGLTDLDEF